MACDEKLIPKPKRVKKMIKPDQVILAKQFDPFLSQLIRDIVKISTPSGDGQ